MSVEKRMMMAVAVSFVVIVVWTMFFMPKPQPGQQEQPQAVEEAARNEQDAATDEQNPEQTREDEKAEADTSAAEGTEENFDELIAAAETAAVTVETSRFTAVLSNEDGGSFKSFLVKKPDGSGDYYEASFSEQPLDLVADSQLQLEPFAMLGSAVRDGKGNYDSLPAMPVLQGLQDGEKIIVGDEPVTISFKYSDPDYGRLEKTFTFRKDTYVFQVATENALYNSRNNERIVHTFGPGVGDLIKQKEDGNLEPGREGNGFITRKAGEGVNNQMSMVHERGELGAEESKIKESPVADIMAWAGLGNNYFMTMAFSARGEGFIPVYRIMGFTSVGGGEGNKFFELPFLSFQTFRDAAVFRIYAGPKDLEVLEKESEASGENLKDVVSFGWFAFISRPALWVLKQIHTVVGNYGFSIILLTVFINILLLPLIISQRKSMSAMQKLQPQMKSLQAKYKADRGDDIKTRQTKKQKLNEEMMALYKRENVNPMGGCLPLLIQMPILLALFDMFRTAIELRKAPFILWWENLSASDPTFILPIMMGLAMFLQQRMTPTPADSQSGALKILPFIFVFLFASAPSGLVLYWFTSSLFNLGTQVVMNRLTPAASTAGKKQGQQGSKKVQSKKGKTKQ